MKSKKVRDADPSKGHPDLLRVVATFLGTTPEKLAGDPVAYRAHVEKVRAAAAAFTAAMKDPNGDVQTRDAAAEQLEQILNESAEAGVATARQRMTDLPGTLTALGIDLSHFAEPLLVVMEWMEQRTPEAGAAVDRLVRSLERAAQPLLGAERERREAERDTRIRNSARAAIAARLGNLDD